MSEQGKKPAAEKRPLTGVETLPAQPTAKRERQKDKIIVQYFEIDEGDPQDDGVWHDDGEFANVDLARKHIIGTVDDKKYADNVKFRISGVKYEGTPTVVQQKAKVTL